MQYKKQSWIKLSDIYPQYGVPGIVVYIKNYPALFFYLLQMFFYDL